MIYKRLLARIPEPRSSPVGICGEDVVRIPVTPELIAELIECLESSDRMDLVMGLFVAKTAPGNPKFARVAGNNQSRIADLARRTLTHPNRQVRSSALETVVAYRAFCSDYRNLMLGQLASNDSACRWTAVSVAATYLTSEDLALLVPLKNDPGRGETGGMGGPLRYTTRDLALEVVEQIAGRRFPSGDCSEQVDGITISWRSWSSFLNWINRPWWWKMFRG